MKIIFISFLIFFLSCKNKTSEIRCYPSDRKSIMEISNLVKLENTNLDFKDITDKIGSFQAKEYGNIIIEFEVEKIKKRIIPYVYDEGLIKSKNVIKIISDSILIDNGYSISELKRVLKRHYLNKGNIPYYSDSPERAIVELAIDTNSNGKEIKDILTKLTYTFDEIKNEIRDTIELRVFFDYLDNR